MPYRFLGLREERALVANRLNAYRAGRCVIEFAQKRGNSQDLWSGLNASDLASVVDDGESLALEVGQTLAHGLKLFG